MGGARRATVTLPLRGADVAMWDEGAGGWRAAAGAYVVPVGGSRPGGGAGQLAAQGAGGLGARKIWGKRYTKIV